MFWVLLCQDRLASSRPSCFARQLESEHFGNCEKDSASVRCANKGLCPFETCKPFFEGLDPKIYCFCLPKSYKNRSRKFRIEPFLKGSWVSRGQSPPFADIANAEPFSQFHNPPRSNSLCRRQNPKHHQKNKTPADMAGVFHAVLYAFSSGAETELSPATGISGVSDAAAPVSSSREGVEPSLSSSPFISLTKVSPLAFSFLIRY